MWLFLRGKCTQNSEGQLPGHRRGIRTGVKASNVNVDTWRYSSGAYSGYSLRQHWRLFSVYLSQRFVSCTMSGVEADRDALLTKRPSTLCLATLKS